MVFLCVFLPAAFCLHLLLPGMRAKNFLLVVASLVFYAYGEPIYVILLVASSAGNYILARLTGECPKIRKLTMTLAVVINLGLLVIFKYSGFLVDTFNSVTGAGIPVPQVRMPIGISFFTFQALSYVIDVYRGDASVQKNFGKVLLYISFFPQLIAGPIVKYHDVEAEINNRKQTPEEIGKGIRRFIAGLSKKVLIANTMGLVADNLFGAAATGITGPGAWLGAVSYMLQIYFDFSGYSDMAMGLGLLFNIKLPVNFNSPYKACTVKELWQRWHITLSRFFIQYVYIPLGGSRKGKVRTLINTFLVFFLSGLWHGANWTYVAWGSMQGLLVVFDNLHLIGVRGSNEKEKARFYIPKWLGVFFTFTFFNLSLFFFRSDSMTNAFTMFRNLFSFRSTGYLTKIAAQLDIPEFYLIRQAINLFQPSLLNTAYLILFVLLLVISAVLISRKNALQLVEEKSLTGKFSLMIVVLFCWCIISFSQVSTFIYFNF